MKNILLKKLVLFLGMFLVIFSQVNSQNHYFSKSEEVVFTRDRVVIYLGDHVGDIQWQSSPDSLTWHDIAGAQADSLVIVAESPAYYRARVVAGICDPFYSEMTVIQPIEKKEVVEDIAAIILPDLFVSQILEEMESFADDPEYEQYVDEMMHSLISLHDSIMTYYAAEEFQEAIEQFYADFYDPQKSGLGCDIVNIGLGYAKGLSIDQGVSGSLGFGVVNKLKALGGGGIEIIYDLTNQTSQVYVYSFCSPRYGFGAGLSAAISAGYGFTGYVSWLMGIPELETPRKDLFAGSSRTKSIDLSIKAAKGLGVDLDLSYGRSGEIDFNCEGVITFLECPSDAFNAATIPEGISTFSFGAGAGAKVGLGIEYAAYMGTLVNCHLGIWESFVDYPASGRRNSKKMAGLRMAASLISPSPLDGFSAARLPTDLIAAAAAFIYAVNDLAECNSYKKPTIITKEEIEIVDANLGAYKLGGMILDNGGREITRRGVAVRSAESVTNQFEYMFDSDDHSDEFFAYTRSLMPNKEYVIAAFARNYLGTSYGNEVPFSTKATPAEVITNHITDITESTAKGGGTVLNDGGALVTSRGVVISATNNPTLSDYVIQSGAGTGTFSVNITGLTPSTKYYVRAYATNSAGTAYGNQVTFLTTGENGSNWPRDTETEIVDVTNPTTGKTWMDRNLGASRAATSSTDAEAYGDLYQWGRAADGHQKRTSGTTSTLSSSDTSGHSNFITSNSGANWDWRSPQNDNLWQGVNGINNPCPDGYRLPTEAELYAEQLSWDGYNSTGAFASPLKVPLAGSRDTSDGSVKYLGSRGHYWSSTVDSSNSGFLFFFSDGGYVSPHHRAFGFSLRCLKDAIIVLPTVTTSSISNIGQKTATGGGNVTLDGGAPVTARGIVYSTSQNPTTTNNRITVGSGTGTFTANMSGLTPNTTYYVRAYASNSDGTSYGNQVQFTTQGSSDETGTFTDSRDGQTYKWVKIGDQVWMVENLNYEINNSWCYHHHSGNCSNYGRLYSWSAATTACPPGWHLPSDNEWKQLEMYMGMPNSDADRNGWRSPGFVGTKLKAKLSSNPTWNGDDDVGFTALPGGLFRANGSFDNMGSSGYWWSATESGHFAWSRQMSTSEVGVYRFDVNKALGLSVRCLKDGSATPPKHNLTLTVNPPGSGEVSGSGLYETGESVSITASENVGWVFVEWTGNTDVLDDPVAANITITMPEYNITLTANFEKENGGDEPRDTETEVVDVTNPTTGKIWMDRNLGASRAATSITDEEAYGDLYQWGRASDGHQKRTSGTTSTMSSSDTPGHGNFILGLDWRSPQNDNLWQGVNGVNNPCPNGYRLPTDAEWDAEIQSWSSRDVFGAFNSPLKLAVSGLRLASNGDLNMEDRAGYYWSTNVIGIESRALYFEVIDAGVSNALRSAGLSLRCLKH